MFSFSSEIIINHKVEGTSLRPITIQVFGISIPYADKYDQGAL